MHAARILVIEPEPDVPVGRLGHWLTDAGAQLAVVSPQSGDVVPADLEGADGLVVMGGHMGAGDDAHFPWLAQVRALLAQAVRREVPTWAVCLGAQLLAQAGGGQVDRGAQGPEFGAQLVAKRQAASDDPLFAEVPITPDVVQWHVDAVSRLPAGATLLASSPMYENQAFRVGRFAWATQFHVEVDEPTVRDWVVRDAPLLADRDVERILARTSAVLDDVQDVWAPVAQRFVQIASDPSTAYPPIATTDVDAADPAAVRAALAAQMQAARAPRNIGFPTVLSPPSRSDPGEAGR